MTTVMLSISGLLALTGALLLGLVVLAAFRESTRSGLLTLVVPGYALLYAWRTMKRPLLPVGILVAFVAAGAAGFFSTAFEPNLTIEQGPSDGFGDLDAPLNTN